jgi:hypothetical protein
VTLLITLVLVTLVLFALFLGGTLVGQGYLYQSPVDKLPLRAISGALLVGLFLTLWVWIDKRHPRKYDTFFEFVPYETKTFDEFEAVRWTSPDGSKFKMDSSGNKTEIGAKFKRGLGANSSTFFEDGSGAKFELNGANKSGESFMTCAIKLKPEADADVVRFNARLNPDKKTYAAGMDGRRFDEEKGSRYVQAEQLGVMYVPSNGTIVLALLLNLLHLAVWFAVFWPILHFSRGHAFVLAASFGVFTMILVMPLLFKPNRAPPVVEGPKVALVWEPGDRRQGAGDS